MRSSSRFLLGRSSLLLFSSSTPTRNQHHAARIKYWPQKRSIPENFCFTAEQKYRAKSIPRDTGKIPKDFVLSMLYRHQPCVVSYLWSFCSADPRVVLDGKKHLREVLQQLRAEGYVSFEKNFHTQEWEAHLTRERYDDVRSMIKSTLFAAEKREEKNLLPLSKISLNTELKNPSVEALSASDKEDHLAKLEKQLALTTQKLTQYQFVEMDYVPYTDLNGKVKFMWWYETSSLSPQESMVLLDSDEKASKLEAN